MERSFISSLLLRMVRVVGIGALVTGTAFGPAVSSVLGSDQAGPHHHGPAAPGPAAAARAGLTDTPAATLRVTLNKLLAEHVYLAARATGAALGGRAAEFEAAASALDANSVDLSKAIGAAYGPEAEAAFLPLWRSHIGMVVEYTQGLAMDDTARQQKAVADLLQYTEDFGAFLSGANENLPKDTVASLVKDHVLTLKDVIDAQKAGDQGRVYAQLRIAMMHMSMIADPLAAATAMKYPDRFPGAADSPAATLRVTLNNLLAEHVFLAASATGGALGGRMAQFEGAAGALVGGNSSDIARAIGTAYGPEAEAAFLPLWNSHINMVVEYTQGLAMDDTARQQKAVADLLQYTEDFGAFLSGANENLPKDTVASLVKDHVLTLKAVIDAQKAGDQAAQFAAIRMAAGHMSMIADPLAEATAVKFSDKFGDATGASTSVDLQQFAFRPAELRVSPGTTVTWTNRDAIQHSVTDRGASFDSGLFVQGQRFSHTFAQPGTYSYYCTRHPSMQGTVTVG